MKSFLVAAAAVSLVSVHVAHAGYVVTDMGTGLFGQGIVPVPGIGYSPFWAGNTVNLGNNVQISNDVVSAGVQHADANVFNTRYDLNPAGYYFSGVTSVTWGPIVGFVGGTCDANGLCSNGPIHAAAWAWGSGGTVPVFSDLHPAGYTASMIQGENGNGLYGWAQDAAQAYHPMIWQGTPANATPLPLPGTLTQGAAVGAAVFNSFYVAGFGSGADNIPHPVAWVPNSGSYTSVDLLPANGTTGVAVGAMGYILGGSVQTTSSGDQWHAAIWGEATASSFRDVHPTSSKYLASSIYAMASNGGNPAWAVGLAVLNKQGRPSHAMMWHGGTLKPTDLHGYLGASFVQSVATGVNEYGDISGAAQDTSGVWHQVYWGH